MAIIKNLIGMTFGKLTVLGRDENSIHGKTQWKCSCECGNETISVGGNLVNGRSKSCGCVSASKARNRALDISGKRFGKLTAIKYVGNNGIKRLWECKCDCGNYCIVKVANLTNNYTKSCGCLQHKGTHNLTRHPLYKVIHGMKDRCYNKSCSMYYRYGGRGISICDRWLGADGFVNFIQDMGDRPENGTIERRDNNAGYSPENCYWASAYEQAKNRSTTRIISFNGISMPLKDWARSLNISDTSLRLRIDKRGWSLEKALTTGDSRFKKLHS